MAQNNSPIKADNFYKDNPNPITYPRYTTGDVVVLKLSGEKLLVFEELEHDNNDPTKDKVGPKYFTRTMAHGKKVVYACEIRPYHENSRTPFVSK